MVRRLRVVACGLVVLAALLAGGCTPESGPTQSTSPSPSVSASPSPTPSPTPTENAQERQQRLDFEAAKGAYLAGSAEYQRLLMAGGAMEPTAKLKQTTGGFQLKSMTNAIRMMKKNGWRTDRASTQTVVANGGWSAKELRLTACEDTSKVRFLNKKGKEVHSDQPVLYVHSLTATKHDGVWKITNGESEAVTSFAEDGRCGT